MSLHRGIYSMLRRSMRKISRPESVMHLCVKRQLREAHGYCDHTCWQCSKVVKGCTYFCSGCDKIQPLALSQPDTPHDYFALLQIPKTYDIDVKQLERNYHSIQKKLHPDLFNSSTEKEKEISADLSSIINQAYWILKSPLTRAGYMLTLMGMDPFAESNIKPVDPTLLMEVMDMRSHIEESKSNEELLKLKDINDNAIKSVLTKLSNSFKDSNKEEAYESAVRLQYLTRIDDILGEKLP